MQNNIITAAFGSSRKAKTRSVYQWDYGMILRFTGLSLPEHYEVHFANQPGGLSKTALGDENGVEIINEYLTTGKPVYAWVYVHTGDSDGETVYMVTIPVIPRARPTDQPATPQQQTAISQALDLLNRAIEGIEDAAVNAERAENAASAAEDSADTAAASAQAAAQSASAASTSASSAAGDATAAASSATAAATSAQQANGSTMAANAAATSAASSASAAAQQVANASGYASQASASATAAANSATAAGTSEQNAAGSASSASASAMQANRSATQASSAATGAASSASIAGQQASIATSKAEAAAASATAAADSAADAAGSASAAAQTLTDVNAAGAAQITAIDAEGSTQTAAVTAEGQRVLASIPSDYTELSGEVNDLKSQTADLESYVRDMSPVVTAGPSAIISVLDAAPLNADGLVVNIEPVQSGSGDPSPDNVRPISGWTGANVTINDATTFITFPSEAGAVYGGTLDVTTGVLTVDRAIVDLGTLSWQVFSVSPHDRFGTNGLQGLAVIPPTDSTLADILCSAYPIDTATHVYNHVVAGSVALGANGRLYCYDPNYSTSADFKAAMSGVQLCYRLISPITYNLTPQEVALLCGNNTVFADTGNTTLTYRQDVATLLSELTAPDETDMTANANYAVNGFFTVGGTLYKATAAIATGETIAPGSNCVATTIADQLTYLYTQI